MIPVFRRTVAATMLAAGVSIAATAPALATKDAVIGPVSFTVPDDFVTAARPRPSLYEAASGITLEVSELPPQALQQFKGEAFLEYLTTLGYENAAYANGALKRTDTHTYVLADAKGKDGPESRFLLVLGNSDRAAIVTAFVLKTQLENGKANRADIETILSSVSMVGAKS